jgi:hypothetical protein
MGVNLKQLIPGNPGTSFVVSLMYAARCKYGIKTNNKDQLSLFTKGIVNSRNVFFSGVLNRIASGFDHKIFAFTNRKLLINLARNELNKELVEIKLNRLGKDEVKKLISKYFLIVFSVDMNYFRPYHDYHFVCIGKKDNKYEVFEPISSKTVLLDENEFQKLIISVSQGLRDVTIAFCL